MACAKGPGPARTAHDNIAVLVEGEAVRWVEKLNTEIQPQGIRAEDLPSVEVKLDWKRLGPPALAEVDQTLADDERQHRSVEERDLAFPNHAVLVVPQCEMRLVAVRERALFEPVVEDMSPNSNRSPVERQAGSS
ncbi:MAG: hypothetical protein ACM3O7_06165 [Acidobacteriota bacterium]